MKPVEAWQSGIVLRDALFEYGNPDIIARYRNAMETPVLEGAVAAFATMLNLAENKQEAEKSADQAQAVINERAALETRLKKEVVGQLRDGTLTALAFEAPRHVDSKPVIVPRSAWVGKIDWRNATLENDGLKFIAVRIIKPDPLNLPDSAAPGRPSRRDQLIEAYTALRDAGAIDFNASLSSHFPAIKKWIGERYRDEHPSRGLGDRTMWKVLGPLFDGDRDEGR